MVNSSFEYCPGLPIHRSRGCTRAKLGLYASISGQEAEAFAEFDWVEYVPRGRD